MSLIDEIFLERIIDGKLYQCGFHEGAPVVAYESDNGTKSQKYDDITQARASFWTMIKSKEKNVLE